MASRVLSIPKFEAGSDAIPAIPRRAAVSKARLYEFPSHSQVQSMRDGMGCFRAILLALALQFALAAVLAASWLVWRSLR